MAEIEITERQQYCLNHIKVTDARKGMLRWLLISIWSWTGQSCIGNRVFP